MTKLYKHCFSRNKHGKDYVIGDIHGHKTILMKELDRIGFDFTKDRLFSVGDICDRGPESKEMIDLLFEPRPWLFPILGNHEQMAIDFANGAYSVGDYHANGGAWNVANSYQDRLLIKDSLETLPLYIEVETDRGMIGIVHAEVPGDDWSNTDKHPSWAEFQTAQWSRDRYYVEKYDRVKNVDFVYVGHTPMEEVWCSANMLYLDTMGWRPGKGHFTIVDINTGEIV